MQTRVSMQNFFKVFLFLFVDLITVPSKAQLQQFTIQNIALPAELRDFDNQFSCLNIHKGRFFLMPESRILEGQEAKLYSIKLSDINHYFHDTTYQLTYQKHAIVGFDKLVNKMLQQGQVCEGLEAMAIKGKEVFLSVETTTASAYCFILKGRLKNNNVVLDTTKLLAVWKPVKSNGEAIYNASFECMELKRKRLQLFFEYNYFEGNNYVYSINKNLKSNSKDSVRISRMPYRISDLKSVGKNHYTAINSFYKGGGKDTINRPSVTDTDSYSLVNNGKAFHDYARLVDIYFNGNEFTWKPLYEMPVMYEGFNWEGIAHYKGGYFIVNDKYSPSKPYYSSLMYLKPAP